MAVDSLLKLAPQPVSRPWGGGRTLVERYGKPAPPPGGEPLGESWEASGLDGRISRVAEGPYAGRPVTEAIGRPLPLLIKLIECAGLTSVQVHPDEDSADLLGSGARPKCEAWHVLFSEPGAYICFGARHGVSAGRLIDACASGEAAEVERVLQRVPVAAGDTIYVPAGTVHAIGPGVVLYEVQQPSDTTYRLFDWGRVGADGRPRDLHLREAEVALRGPVRGDPRRETELVPGRNPRIMLCRCPYFRIDLCLVDKGELVIPESRNVTFITAIGGDGVLQSEGGETVAATGDTFCIPPGVDWAARPGRRGLRLLHARIPRLQS